mmetsp:Transcript_28202/g.80968  ORF Transcript_28202/g.80968 Transcript_28202/m.80968 type:complete len:232 (+) Transcript_28202:125-820(+)
MAHHNAIALAPTSQANVSYHKFSPSGQQQQREEAGAAMGVRRKLRKPQGFDSCCAPHQHTTYGKFGRSHKRCSDANVAPPLTWSPMVSSGSNSAGKILSRSRGELSPASSTCSAAHQGPRGSSSARTWNRCGQRAAPRLPCGFVRAPLRSSGQGICSVPSPFESPLKSPTAAAPPREHAARLCSAAPHFACSHPRAGLRGVLPAARQPPARSTCAAPPTAWTRGQRFGRCP